MKVFALKHTFAKTNVNCEFRGCPELQKHYTYNDKTSFIILRLLLGEMFAQANYFMRSLKCLTHS